MPNKILQKYGAFLMENLKNCPLCGSAASWKYFDTHLGTDSPLQRYSAGCVLCAIFSPWFAFQKQAAQWWNLRPHEKDSEEALFDAKARVEQAELAVKELSRKLAIQTRTWKSANPEDFSKEYWEAWAYNDAKTQIKHRQRRLAQEDGE